MLSLLNVHHNINKDIFFDECLTDDSFTIYKSSKIEDIFWNFAVLSGITSFKKISNEIYSHFEKLQRKPCVYINAIEADTLRELLEDRFIVRYTESWLRYNGEGLENVHAVKEVKKEEDFAAFERLINRVYDNQSPQRNIYTPSYLRIMKNTFTSKNFCHFLCFADGQAVAGASMGFYNGYCMIYNLVTHPDYVGKGYAQSVIHACTQRCKEIGGKEIYALVDANTSTEKKLMKNGFKKVFTGYGLIKQP